MQEAEKPRISLSNAIAIQQRRNWMAAEQEREVEREAKLRLRRWQERMKDRIWKAFNDWFVATTGIVDMEDAVLTIDVTSCEERIIPSGRPSGDFIAYEGVGIRWTFPNVPGDISYVGDFVSQPDGSIRAAPQRDACWLARHRGDEARCYRFENAVIFAKGLEKEVPFYDTQSN